MVAEPFNLTFSAIGQLTDYQIAEIICHPRDEDGSIDLTPKRTGKVSAISFVELFRRQLKARGLNEEEIEKQLREKHPNAPR